MRHQTRPPSPLDPFVPAPDIRERFEIAIGAPAGLVMDVAASFDLRALPLVRGVFRLRELLMGAERTSERPSAGLVADTRAMGWASLGEVPGRSIVSGAACQPWLADVRFVPIPAERFASHAEPDQVKIAWTLEATPLGEESSRFVHEVRVVATDEAARAKFGRYWRWARFGIIGIRYLMLPAIRRSAERRWRETNGRGAGAS